MAWIHKGRKYWYHNGKRYSRKIKKRKKRNNEISLPFTSFIQKTYSDLHGEKYRVTKGKNIIYYDEDTTGYIPELWIEEKNVDLEHIGLLKKEDFADNQQEYTKPWFKTKNFIEKQKREWEEEQREIEEDMIYDEWSDDESWEIEQDILEDEMTEEEKRRRKYINERKRQAFGNF